MMSASELITQLRELHLLSNTNLDELRELTLIDEEVDTSILVAPFTMYDIEYDWVDETIVNGRVVPLKVTRYGILPGCSAPSITVVRSRDRQQSSVPRQWYSTLNMYYFSEERAKAEIDYQIKAAQKRRATIQLSDLIDEYFCVLIDSVNIAVLDSQLSSLTMS